MAASAAMSVSERFSATSGASANNMVKGEDGPPVSATPSTASSVQQMTRSGGAKLDASRPGRRKTRPTQAGRIAIAQPISSGMIPTPRSTAISAAAAISANHVTLTKFNRRCVMLGDSLTSHRDSLGILKLVPIPCCICNAFDRQGEVPPVGKMGQDYRVSREGELRP